MLWYPWQTEVLVLKFDVVTVVTSVPVFTCYVFLLLIFTNILRYTYISRLKTRACGHSTGWTFQSVVKGVRAVLKDCWCFPCMVVDTVNILTLYSCSDGKHGDLVARLCTMYAITQYDYEDCQYDSVFWN